MPLTLCIILNEIIKTSHSEIKGQIIKLKQAKNSENSQKYHLKNCHKMSKKHHFENFLVQK